jgi:hypothetical protein
LPGKFFLSKLVSGRNSEPAPLLWSFDKNIRMYDFIQIDVPTYVCPYLMRAHTKLCRWRLYTWRNRVMMDTYEHVYVRTYVELELTNMYVQCLFGLRKISLKVKPTNVVRSFYLCR